MEPRRMVLLYDGQCELCQAGVAWMRLLDEQDRVECVPVQSVNVEEFAPSLTTLACLEQLHCIAEDGEVFAGWDALVAVTALLPRLSWFPRLDRSAQVHYLGDAGYRWVARNRYQLSKCRGGACAVDHVKQTRQAAGFGPFWACYTLGMFASLPLMARAASVDLARNTLDHLRTRRRVVKSYPTS